MATRIIGGVSPAIAPSSEGAPNRSELSTPAATLAPLLELNARYLIASRQSPDDLAEDASLLLAAGLGVFEDKVEELDQAWSWACVYLLRQAHAVLAEQQRISRGDDDLLLTQGHVPNTAATRGRKAAV